MAKLQDSFNEIIAKIEKRITNKEDLEFIKEQIADISMLYIDKLNKIMDISERRVNQVYENQKILDKKIAEVEKGMNVIEKELFVEEDYDFEITCPYCNNEFVADVGSDVREIKCPECNNTIELEWNQEEECGGNCGSCGGCAGHEDEEFQDDINDNDDDDDM